MSAIEGIFLMSFTFLTGVYVGLVLGAYFTERVPDSIDTLNTFDNYMAEWKAKNVKVIDNKANIVLD